MSTARASPRPCAPATAEVAAMSRQLERGRKLSRHRGVDLEGPAPARWLVSGPACFSWTSASVQPAMEQTKPSVWELRSSSRVCAGALAGLPAIGSGSGAPPPAQRPRAWPEHPELPVWVDPAVLERLAAEELGKLSCMRPTATRFSVPCCEVGRPLSRGFNRGLRHPHAGADRSYSLS